MKSRKRNLRILTLWMEEKEPMPCSDTQGPEEGVCFGIHSERIALDITDGVGLIITDWYTGSGYWMEGLFVATWDADMVSF